MKIIHAHKYFYYRRGAERYMLDLMRMQEARGHQVIPFSMHYPKNLPSAWENFFVSEIQTEQGSSGLFHAWKQTMRALWSWEAKRKFASLVDAVSPDIVHVHNIYTHISPSILKVCQERGIPVVMTVHDYALASANYALWDEVKKKSMDINHIGLFATARTKFIKHSYLATFVLELIESWHRFCQQYEKPINMFLANSNFTALVLTSIGIKKEKIKVLYPFTEIPKNVSYKDEGFVLYLGALEDYKGVDVLIDAMKSFPKTILKIAGLGPYEQILRLRARGMKNIEFMGFAEGTARTELLSSARVCVVPSIWHEPFGLSAVEAMAHMTPVIVSDAGGLKEIVEPGVSGEVFKSGNSKDLVSKLRLFIDNADYARSLAQDAYKRAKELGDPEKHYHQVMDIYSEVLQED
ncbi:MAG: glycosyltransferase family 4 protein [Patescibacteria group bacterium]